MGIGDMVSKINMVLAFIEYFFWQGGYGILSMILKKKKFRILWQIVIR